MTSYLITGLHFFLLSCPWTELRRSELSFHSFHEVGCALPRGSDGEFRLDVKEGKENLGQCG